MSHFPIISIIGVSVHAEVYGRDESVQRKTVHMFINIKYILTHFAVIFMSGLPRLPYTIP